MKLEQQVCSLELAQKLKELGVPQESLWYWKKLDKEWEVYLHYIEGTPQPQISAFTVAELGELLPEHTASTKEVDKDWRWRCELKDEQGYVSASGATTEVDAKAKMLIYLIENNLISI